MQNNNQMLSPYTSVLFKPFNYIAGAKGLVYGILVIFATSFVAYFSKAHFDGALDMHTYSKGTYSQYIFEGAIDWLSVAITLSITGLLLSQSKVRAIDMFGTVAMARWPMLLVSVVAFITDGEKVNAYIMSSFNTTLSRIKLTNSEICFFVVFIIVSLLLLIWMIQLMYHAYSISANIKGTKGVVSFTIALIAAEILSKLAMSLIY